MKKPKIYIGHIRDAIDNILEYVGNYTREDFASPENIMVQDAVVRKMEIIGEAARALIQNIREEDYPDIPWQKIIGMRNRIAHEYFDVDLLLVWDTAVKDLPDLKIKLDQILTDM